MTIGNENCASRRWLSTSSPSTNRNALKHYISSNDEQRDIGVAKKSSGIKTHKNAGSILKGKHEKNNYFKDGINDINNNFGHHNSSNTSYLSAATDITSSPTNKTLSKSGAAIRLSFQLMTRAEPIEMVIATIKSLLKIKAPDDEILIIDNNHNDKSLYEPLAAFCDGLNAKLNVHFYHIDAVEGFKAGALNLALGLMNPNSTHVVVVDSDYQALPQARTSIAAAINNHPDHALLQFPQFYRDVSRDDVHSELNHYFNYHLYRPFNRQRALSTGTYAVIRRSALLDLGGWSGASLTEDAQIGVLMHRHGLRSEFIPEVIATGLLPTTVGDLMSQRQRWIYGNMQVLNNYFSIRPRLSSRMASAEAINDPVINESVINDSATNDCVINDNYGNDKSVNDKEKLDSTMSLDSPFIDSLPSNSFGERFTYMRAHWSQLSAWINFTGIFILLHISTLLIIAGAVLIDAPVNLLLLLTPLYLVYVVYGLFLSRRLWAYLHDFAPLNQQVSSEYTIGINNLNVSKKLRAWLLHLNFWELGALSWFPVLWGRDKPFICTPKQQFVRTQRAAWKANIIALPKLVLVLNIITAVVVAPFSPLYSPILFMCAVTVCLLKLWAAKVIFNNYAYTEPSSSTGVNKSKITLKEDRNAIQNSVSSMTKKAVTTKIKNKDIVNL